MAMDLTDAKIYSILLCNIFYTIQIFNGEDLVGPLCQGDNLIRDRINNLLKVKIIQSK